MTPRALRFQLWLIVAALCGFGLVMIASTTGMMTRTEGAVTFRFVTVQAAAMGIGIVAALVIGLLGADRLRSPLLMATAAGVTLCCLAAVLVFGAEVNGAKRWINLGVVKFQPAELAKLLVVLGTAWHFARMAERARSAWHGVLMPLAAFAVVGGMVYLTKDLGSVVVMLVVLGSMMFFAGAPWWYFLGLMASLAPAVAYYTVYAVGYRRERILAFADPWIADGPTGHHLRQSFIAIGSGGLLGVGLGESTAKLAFLPEKHTDFIFAVICEELGLVGGMGVALAFLLLVATGLAIAAQARDLHHRLLAVGATMVLGVQAFWNMLVVTGAVPTKGLTLPFISYGGSSVIVCLCLVGILDAVARQAKPVGHVTSHTRIGAAVRGGKSLRWQTEE